MQLHRAVCAALGGELTENLIYDYHDQNFHTSAWKSGKKITLEIFGVTPDKVVEMMTYLITNYPPVRYASIPLTVVGTSGYYPGYLAIKKDVNEKPQYYTPGQRPQNVGSTAIIYSIGIYMCE